MSAYKETLLFTTQKISPKTWTTKNIITITNSSLNEFPVSSCKNHQQNQLSNGKRIKGLFQNSNSTYKKMK